MTRLVNMILKRLGKSDAAGDKNLTKEQKEAQKRVRKAMKAAHKMRQI